MTEPTTRTTELNGLVMYLNYARKIHCSTRSQKLLLLYYASCCNKEGQFHPSIERITEESGLSEDTVYEINKHFRDDLKIMTWSRGFKNRHMKSGVANRYQFDASAMERIIKSQPSTSGADGDATEASTPGSRSSTSGFSSSTSGFRVLAPPGPALAPPAQPGTKNHLTKEHEEKNHLEKNHEARTTVGNELSKTVDSSFTETVDSIFSGEQPTATGELIDSLSSARLKGMRPDPELVDIRDYLDSRNLGPKEMEECRDDAEKKYRKYGLTYWQKMIAELDSRIAASAERKSYA